MAKCLWAMVAGVFVAGTGQLQADILSFTGDLRADATFISCGSGCTLDTSNSDVDYAQWAAVERDFTVATTSSVQAITFSYGGGTNGHGVAIGAGGFAPYLSLFDASGDFLASTFFGATCPPGANTNAGSGQCFDVLLDAGVLAPGNYAITISAFENMSFAENSGVGTLADGFTGLGGLAFGEDLHFAFDVDLTPASPTTVPEPASGALLAGAGLLWYLTTSKETAVKNRLFRVGRILKTRGFVAAGFILVAIVAGVLTAGPAIAQSVRAALVQNLDEPGRNPLALFQAFSTSPRATWNIPAGKRYVAEQFTADCFLDSTYSLTSIQLGGFTNGTPVRVAAVPHYQTFIAQGLQGINSWIGTGTVRLYADPGSALEIVLTTSGGLSVQPGGCTFFVSGYIINNP